jgi:tetratricopeptide (TPR) repeat protein
MVGFMKWRPIKNFILLSVALLAFPQASLAENFLKEGMAEFAAGNYSDASGHFGGALTTDFNNATLHYYLGSCYAHMKQKDAAIREFRIAYALDPEKEVGQYAKQALVIYGAESAPPGPQLAPQMLEPQLGAASGLAHAAASAILPGVVVAPPPRKTMLEKQADDLKNLREEQFRQSSVQTGVQGDRLVQRTTNDILDSMKYYTRWGAVQPKMTSDGQKQVDYLKRMYDSQKDGIIEAGKRQTAEIQHTAESLQQQMDEQAKAGKLHLSPSGTNLYVRNYEMTPSEAKPTGKGSTAPNRPNK